MEFDEEFDLDHLLFRERRCRVCGERKDLLNDFYLIRRNRKGFPSAYSYECKVCTIKRIKETRKRGKIKTELDYPDW